MALNPITYTEKTVNNFLKYQLTAYPFADKNLYQQMRELLSLEKSRNTPLLKGPYISLSRPFTTGATIDALVDEEILHPFLKNLAQFPNVYGHQEKAIRAVVQGKTTLVSTGTGSGKTECFLYPIISKCLKLKDESAPEGISAIIVYPMNALAEDQLLRLRGLLAGTGITFAMYVGKTPENEADVTGKRLRPGATRKDYQKALEKSRKEKRTVAVHPPEELCSREMMRSQGKQPSILLTNVKQLELLLTRQKDAELFQNARLDFLVFDEAHTFAGANGAETACLIRRLRAYCNRKPEETTCIATSATIADPRHGIEAGKRFASRFFGVKEESVETVSEEYQSTDWKENRQFPQQFSHKPADILHQLLPALEEENNGKKVAEIYNQVSGVYISEKNWQEDLFNEVSGNELLYQVSQILKSPQPLLSLTGELEKIAGRDISEEELIAWLSLATVARKNEKPLIRPVIHAFLKGVRSAVVQFEEKNREPRLWLSPEDIPEDDANEKRVRLPVLACTTCGQHYFTHFVSDFYFTGEYPEGGEAVETRCYWPSLEDAHGGKRVILVDHLISDLDEEETPDKTAEVFLCRFCGTLHPAEIDRCDQCGKKDALNKLFVLSQKEGREGYLSRCLCCGSSGRLLGGRFREPARTVRAITVADVHILAQEMLNHASRKRLLVFTDNRQDAAFQAGWMKDHSRRFQLASLMDRKIQQGPVTIGDLSAYLDDLLQKDEELSRSLAPEVWGVYGKSYPQKHAQQRLIFLRIQVLRELTGGMKQRKGLEAWARVCVHYEGLKADNPKIQNWAAEFKIPADILCNGIANFLDVKRRNSFMLFDSVSEVFSRFWLEGDPYIQQGFIPNLKGLPRGLKFTREGSDDIGRVNSWFVKKGAGTLVKEGLKKWGIPSDRQEALAEEIWNWLVDELKVFIPVTFKNSRGSNLPNCTGVYQIDSEKITLLSHGQIFRCKKCRRGQVREVPLNKCLAWQCDGELEKEPPNPDNYDLNWLENDFEMIRPREHSGQVSHEDREIIERIFKGKKDTLNTLVCTPTLELGIDIGGLDSVLMRNVPPLPANYWQRAGRAGRRHRMAVNITYCRPASHDQSYFSQPEKMLEGKVEPPSFNLRNEFMVRKHVHAAIITRLNKLKRDDGALSESERDEIDAALKQAFPIFVKEYFWERENLRKTLYDLTLFKKVVNRYREELLKNAIKIFEQAWPSKDREVVTTDRLNEYVNESSDELLKVIKILKKRLDWALRQMEILRKQQRLKGTLDPDEDALLKRCDNLVKKFKGIKKKTRSETQGHDDYITLNILSSEGFLPGYGLIGGNIVGSASIPMNFGKKEFELSRPTAMALREFVPGNMIYANGHRFTPRYFHLEPQEKFHCFKVDIQKETVYEVGLVTRGDSPIASISSGAQEVRALPICDVDLSHFSHITDDEDFRFQMAVATYGYERKQWSGGEAYHWGNIDYQFRKNVFFRMLNVGPSIRVRGSVEGGLGYPVCMVCGQSRSPFSSRREQEKFTQGHFERCGQSIEWVGFYADFIADTITISPCQNHQEAYTLLEAIRIAATRILNMEREDLDILVEKTADTEEIKGHLYDPMIGGSGLLEQITERFTEIINEAKIILEDCPSDCQTACIDCMYTFRNAFFHRFLMRKIGSDKIDALGIKIEFSHQIPACLPSSSASPDEMPVNIAENRLKTMLEKAGFCNGTWQKQIDMGRPAGITIPDCFFEGVEDFEPGVCIYLDGLSEHIHGNPITQQKDQQIREQLRAKGYEVYAIPVSNLDDREAMQLFLFRLGKCLGEMEKAREVRQSFFWFVDEAEVVESISNDISDPWQEVRENLVDEETKYFPLIDLWENNNCLPPEVGYEFLNDSNEVIAEALFAWPDKKLALVEADQSNLEKIKTSGWQLFSAVEILKEPNSFKPPKIKE
ncbi:DEAD/DEAH box helicase [Candidatus Riflebacteria bacterium]